MLEVRTAGSDGSAASLARYIYSNHLQSASLELDDTGAIISYEEYHPFGTTAYQAANSAINAVAKRYRFSSKERDEESGLNYHGARYYSPWLCRWCATDMLESKYAGQSPYSYCFNNPIMVHDPDGRQGIKYGGELKGTTVTAQRMASTTQADPSMVSVSVIPGNVSSVDNTTGPRSQVPEFSSAFQTQQLVNGAFIVPFGNSPDRMRGITEREFEGYNVWHDLKEISAKIGKVYPTLDFVNQLDALANPVYRFGQQVTSGITGQQSIENLEGTTAYSATSRSEDVVSSRMFDVLQTASIPIMKGQNAGSIASKEAVVEYQLNKAKVAQALSSDVKLLGTARDNLLNQVEDPKLRNLVGDLYRPGARVGSGSSMDAFRLEALTGGSVGGKTHGIKLLNYRSALQKVWAKRANLSTGDRQITKQLLKDIQNALSGHQR